MRDMLRTSSIREHPIARDHEEVGSGDGRRRLLSFDDQRRGRGHNCSREDCNRVIVDYATGQGRVPSRAVSRIGEDGGGEMAAARSEEAQQIRQEW